MKSPRVSFAAKHEKETVQFLYLIREVLGELNSLKISKIENKGDDSLKSLHYGEPQGIHYEIADQKRDKNL